MRFTHRLTALALLLVSASCAAAGEEADPSNPTVGISQSIPEAPSVDFIPGVTGPTQWNLRPRIVAEPLTLHEIYRSVAPAVVVVRGGTNHGTGFLIEGGWIVTNQHVAEGGKLDIETGHRVVDIHFGRYRDRLMQVDPQPYQALVYATDEARDLAVLKLTQSPSYYTQIQPLKLAQSHAAPGDDCVCIGHPTAGLLWTLRDGCVTGIGNWPQDRIDAVMASLSSTGNSTTDSEATRSAHPKRKVVLSTCAINPGDSGGPIVNKAGELIAVTFGIPKGGREGGISLDKFSYHVHANELEEFLREIPAQPEVAVPSPWAPASASLLEDINADGRWDKWSFAVRERSGKTGIMFDLDQDTRQAFKESYVHNAELRKLWDFEFAISFFPVTRTFYDIDNDGEVDVVLTDVNKDGVCDLAIANHDGTWSRIETKDQRMIDPSLFRDDPCGKRLAEIMQQ